MPDVQQSWWSVVFEKEGRTETQVQLKGTDYKDALLFAEIMARDFNLGIVVELRPANMVITPEPLHIGSLLKKGGSERPATESAIRAWPSVKDRVRTLISAGYSPGQYNTEPRVKTMERGTIEAIMKDEGRMRILVKFDSGAYYEMLLHNLERIEDAL